MRTVIAVVLALGLGAPLAAQAATTGTGADLGQLVAAFDRVQSVRVVETFENGTAATVDVLPSGQFRIAATGGQDATLVMKLATQPVDGAVSTGAYTVTPAGKKTVDGMQLLGYNIVAPDGTYNETVWVNDKHLPVSAHVQTQGHTVDVSFGDYNDSALIARP